MNPSESQKVSSRFNLVRVVATCSACVAGYGVGIATMMEHPQHWALFPLIAMLIFCVLVNSVEAKP